MAQIARKDLPWDPGMVLYYYDPAHPTETASVVVAYLALLRMPHGILRHSAEAQAAMANLRDLIAMATKRDPETIQNACEFYALNANPET